MFCRTYFRLTDFAVTLVTAEKELLMALALSSMLIVLVNGLVTVGETPAVLLAANIACFFGGFVAGCTLARTRK